LLGATGVAGGVAGGMAAAPFLASLRPSRKAQSAGEPVRASVANLAAGELRTTVWRRKLVWLFGRSQEMLQSAQRRADALSDPNSESSDQPAYCKNESRSIRPDVFVAVGLCTHLGCSPRPLQENGEHKFFCACHGSKFDIAGRVLRGSPAPKNLPVPPHHYADDNTVVIGQDADSA
jgi:ubiquinol-cytochrome c reductase iron-sulfur subunit